LPNIDQFKIDTLLTEEEILNNNSDNSFNKRHGSLNSNSTNSQKSTFVD